MPVREMQHRTSSAEITEWQAYEYLTGPLGVEYERTLLREIHFLLQLQIHQAAALNTEKGKKVESPLGKEPEYFMTPAEMMKPREDDDEDEEAEEE